LSPRDFWPEKWETETIIDFHLRNPLEGYRRLTFMMLYTDHCGGQSGERLPTPATWQ
jgi:hypothetical protein